MASSKADRRASSALGEPLNEAAVIRGSGGQVVVTERTRLEENDDSPLMGAYVEVEYEEGVVEEIESENKANCRK